MRKSTADADGSSQCDVASMPTTGARSLCRWTRTPRTPQKHNCSGFRAFRRAIWTRIWNRIGQV